MRCPACGRPMREIPVGGIPLDVCDGGCGGIWFDNFELRKIARAGGPLPEALVQINWDPAVAVDPGKKRGCPRCEGVIMLRHFYGVKREVEIDECPRCAGIWLDRGELEAIQAQYGSDEEKQAAEQRFAEWCSPTTEKKEGVPDSVLPYFSKKIHYNPLGLLGYASEDHGTTGVSDWADVIESPPAHASGCLVWALGVVVPILFLAGGLRVCLVREVTIGVRGTLETLRVSGIGAVGNGLMSIAVALFLHFHFFWGSKDNLRHVSTRAKIASVLLLIAGIALFVWGMVTR